MGLPSDSNGTHILYNWYTGDITLLTPEPQTPAPGYEGHVYAVATPIYEETWALLGETNKYTTHASIRFKNIKASKESFLVDVIGVKGETVHVCAVKIASMQPFHVVPVCKEVPFSVDGTTTVSF